MQEPINGLYIVGQKKKFFGGKENLWKKIGKKSPNMGKRIKSLAISKGQDIYVGTNNGLNVVSLKDLKSWRGIGGKTNVNFITVDAFSRIIVATDNGLNISMDDGSSWITYKRENGLANNWISQIAVHPKKKVIWTTSGRYGLSHSK